MSGFQTHMLIGAVGGLALGKALEALGVGADLGLSATLLQSGGAGFAQLARSGVPLIALSALLATVPDIDEPGSYIARRASVVVTLVVMGLAAFAAVAARLPPLMWGAAGGVGVVVGAIISHVLLRLIRRAAGGHRRLTHSLVLAGVFVLAALGLWRFGFGPWALIPGGLAWGIVVHDLGDIVTPAGVPLVYPLSNQAVRVLPEPFCRFGEAFVGLFALIIGLALVGAIRI